MSDPILVLTLICTLALMIDFREFYYLKCWVKWNTKTYYLPFDQDC